VWAAHTTVAPTISGLLSSAVVGSSRVDVHTLLPEGAESVARREPTPSGEGSHRADHPWGPMWRLEISAPRGAREREFLHFITVDRAAAAPAPAHVVSGPGLRGGVARMDGRTTAVLFASTDSGGSAALGGPVDVLVVAGLAPGGQYHLSIDRAPGCMVNVARSKDARDPVATPGGYVSMLSKECGRP